MVIIIFVTKSNCYKYILNINVILNNTFINLFLVSKYKFISNLCLVNAQIQSLYVC